MNIVNGFFLAAKEAKEADKAEFEADKVAFEADKAAFEAMKTDFKAEKEAKEAAIEAKEAALKQKKQEISKQFELDKISLYKQLDDQIKQLFNMIRDSVKKKEEEIEEKNSTIEALFNKIKKISYYPKIDMFDGDEVDDLNDKKNDLYDDIKACKIVIKYGKELLSSLRDQFKSDKRM